MTAMPSASFDAVHPLRQVGSDDQLAFATSTPSKVPGIDTSRAVIVSPSRAMRGHAPRTCSGSHPPPSLSEVVLVLYSDMWRAVRHGGGVHVGKKR
jgi:hypothetical protein